VVINEVHAQGKPSSDHGATSICPSQTPTKLQFGLSIIHAPNHVHSSRTSQPHQADTTLSQENSISQGIAIDKILLSNIFIT
jgi:hypothetical protein